MRCIVRRLGSALIVPCVLLSGSPAASAQSAQAPAAQAQPADAALPSAQSIIDRHIAATGGKEALAKRQSMRIVGTIAIPANGMTGTLEVFSARPNKQLVKSTLAGVGDMLEGFDGTHAWSINPMMGPMLLTGEELKQRALDADFDSTLNTASRYSAMKTLEKTTFDGRECYKLSLTRKEGGEDIQYYDVATGLSAGSTTSRKTPMGVITVTMTLQDYKKFGDTLQPTIMKQSMQGVEVINTFTTIEFDKVDPKVFELPAQIKALIK